MFKLPLKVSVLITSILVASSNVSAGLLDNIAKTTQTFSNDSTSQKDTNSSNSFADLANLGSITEFAQTGKLDTSALIKDLVDKQCRDQLNARQEWKLISMFMSSEKKEAWETKVCGCATEEAVNATSQADLLKIANPSTRTETVVKVTETAVKACISRLQ